MWSRQELKMRGKMAFQRNYASSVAVALLMGIISLLLEVEMHRVVHKT